MSTIFEDIIAGKAPATIVYQDELDTAFQDINPVAPVHILIVPNKAIRTVNDVTREDEQMLGHLFTAARQIAADLGINKKGYRLLVNCGNDGGQEIYHLHMHLIGGRKLGPMVMRRDR